MEVSERRESEKWQETLSLFIHNFDQIDEVIR